MYERVYCRPRRGDSGVVASEVSIAPRKARHRASDVSDFTKWKFILILLGCGLLAGACANDSTADNDQPRHHRHGNGHGRERMETDDRSSNPSPTPALGW
jgi:hypothetical protein